MKKKDKTMEAWNEFIKPRYECPDCGEQFKYKYNYSLHLNTSHKQMEAARRFH
jgi:uncharacterized C2H2 Zn-finger protein